MILNELILPNSAADGYERWRSDALDIMTGGGALQYRSQHTRFRDLYFVHSNAGLRGGERVLELGAWPAYGFMCFKDSALIVASDSMSWLNDRALTGVDQSPVEWVKACNAIQPNMRSEVIDACDIPYDGFFDLVYSISVLEHIKDDDLALAQMFKALKPGGKMILTTEVNLFVGMPYQEDVFFRVYKFFDAIDKVRAAGFIVSGGGIVGCDNAWAIEMMTPAINNPGVLRQPYKHFVSGGISCVKPEVMNG